MAAELAGTAAIRLVPSLTGFRARAQTELQRQKGLAVDVAIRPKVDTSTAKRQLERFRAKEQADAINLKARIDEADFRRQFQRVEHVFERSAFAKALRLQIKVIGADALYSLIGVAGSAAAALDTVAKSAAILPGVLASAGVAAGVFALALGDVGKAITAVNTEQDQAADKARAFAGAQADSVKAARDVSRAQDDVGRAIRRTIRNYEDLAHAVRGTSLDEADALLNVQESYDRLLEGGQKTLTELRRDQLSYARDLHNLDGVRIQNKRTLEDYNEAQRQGVTGSNEVVTALDAVADAQNRVADAASRMADASQTKTQTGAFARLSPSAKEFVNAITLADSAWVQFTARLQEGVFKGQATNLVDTLNVSLNNLGPSLDKVASQIGGVFLDLGEILRRDDIQGFIKGITEGTAATIGTMRQGLDPLITGFLRMADVGSRHLPQLADLFNRMFERFNAWTMQISSDGTLDRWIENGIRGLESVINIGQNIVLIINDVANAWRIAGGEQTGMIGDAEDLTKQIHSWTSGEGMATMVQQFKQVRTWTANMVEAFKNLWPTIVNIGQTIREWSVTFFTILGYAFRLTAWVEEHTGLVKLLVAAYLSIRTVKPLWDMLTNAGMAYTNMMMRASTLGGPAGAFARNSVAGLATVQTSLGKTGTAAQTMASKFTAAQGAAATSIKTTASVAGGAAQGPLRSLQAGFMNLITPINSTAGQVRSLNGFLPAATNNMAVMGSTAATAAGKVGTSRSVGLWGAAAGLAGFLGPMAAGIAATGGIIWAIDKMGEAHRRAAAEAQNQKNILDGLKATLDQFTGAVTPQTMQQGAQAGQKYTITGLGDRNVFEDLARANVGISGQQLLGATNPTQQQQRTDILNRLDTETESKITASREWERGKGFWESHGVSARTLAQAMNGDPAAVSAVQNAEKQLFDPHNTGNLGNAQYQKSMRGKESILDLTAMIQNLGTHDLTAPAIFLRDKSQALVTQGTANQQSSALAHGTAGLKPGVTGYGPDPEVHMSGPDTAIVVTRGPVGPDFAKNFPPEIGTVTPLPDGRAQVTLTREGFNRDFEKHAAGGMVRGSGSGTSDSNLIQASRGEFIVRKEAVNAIGVQNLDRINSGRIGGFAVGGLPFPLGPGPVVPTPPVLPGPGGLNTQAANPFDIPKAPVQGPGLPRPTPQPPVLNTPPAPLAPPAAAPAPYTPTVDATAAGTPHGTGASPSVPDVSFPTVPTTTGMPYSPYTTGQPVALPPPVRFAGIAPGLQPNTLKALSAIEANFPDITNIGGVREDALKWHPSGLALDIVIPGGSTRGGNNPAGLARGNAIWAWMQQHASELGIDMSSSLWQTDQGGDHFDHIHLAAFGNNNPGPDGTGFIPGLGGIQIPGVTVSPYAPTINGMPTIGGLPGGQQGPQSFMDLIIDKYREAYKPENIAQFLMGQAQNVGSTLMGVGTSFLQGITGIDLSGVLGHGQSVISHFTGSGSSGSGGGGSSLQAGSPMDQAISGDIGQFFDPNAGVNIPGIVAGAMPNFAGSPGPGNAGVDKWEPIIGQVVRQMIEAGLIDPREERAWINAVKRQMSLESSGNPNAVNNWDSNAAKGTPSKGLMQMIESTFNEHRVPGIGSGEWLDPVSQIAASIMYAKSKGGPNYMTGRHGYAHGGSPPGGGLIRVSRGEYRMSPKAVSRVGVGFMNHINGFSGGGFPVANPGRGDLGIGWLGRGATNGIGTSSPGAGPPTGFFQGPPMLDRSRMWPGPVPGAGVPGTPGSATRGPAIWDMFPDIQSRSPVPSWAGPGAGYAKGGLPFFPRGQVPQPRLPRGPEITAMQPPAPAPTPQPIKPMVPQAPAPRPAGPPGGEVRQVAPAPAPVAPTTGPTTGSAGGESAGALPNFSPFVPGQPTGQPPTPAGMVMPDARSAYQGAAPGSNQHTIGWLDQAIKEGSAHAGQLAGTALSMGMGSMGMPGGAQAGQLLQAGIAMAGQVAAGVANVISSAGVGTIMGIGTKATPSGAPLLPQNPVMGFGQLPGQDEMAKGTPRMQGGGGGPLIMNVYNGGIHTNNMDEWQRRQQLLERQQEQPLTNSFVH